MPQRRTPPTNGRQQPRVPLNARPVLARGFSLLEALVALVLISTTGLAVFGWINTNLDAAARLRERDATRHQEAAALAFAQTLNPLQQPQGETDLDPDLRLRWTSRPLGPLTAAVPLPGGISTPFRLQLFELQLELLPARSGRPHGFSVTRIGVERDPVEPFPSSAP